MSELDPLEDDEPSTNSKDDHPIPEHVFQFVEKTIAAGEFDQQSQKPPLPRKKKTGHPSWNAYSAMKLNLETIKEEIAAFTAYCAQLCFTLLTWQVVLTGRIAYVGLPSNDDRRTYLDRFKKNGTTPQCVEQINYTYDTRILKDLCDKHLVRFAVPEKTGDNVHYFLFKKDNKGNAVLQYKMKRYSFAMWPRKYHEGQSYEHAEYGFGTVCRCEPFKDPISKQKYWKNTVQFTREDGSSYETVFKTNAAKLVILVFPSCANGERTLALDFPLAPLMERFQSPKYD